MIEIKPNQWRDLPALVGWLELERSMLGDDAKLVKVMQSDTFPYMLAAAPLHLPLLEVLLCGAGGVCYTFNQDESRARHLCTWANNPTKWTPALANEVSDELMLTLLDYEVCPFVLGMMEGKRAISLASSWKAKQENRWRAPQIWNSIVVELLRRKDLAVDTRLALAVTYSSWNVAPHMLSVMFSHLGFTVPQQLKIMQTMGPKESTNASQARFRQVATLLERELRKDKEAVK